MSLRFFRIATWLLVVALTVATGVVLWRGQTEVPTTGEAALGGPFTLTDVEGNRVTEQVLDNRPHAIFFGFTHCPDVCPTTLAELSLLVDDLGADAEEVDVYFVTVDPERDDPETLKSYLSSFTGKIHGLTGSEEEIADFVSSYRVYARKVPTDGGDYSMDHTASVFLFGRDGRFRGTISHGESHGDALAKLRRLVEA